MNSLSTPEYVQLKATLIILNTKNGRGGLEFRCEDCLSKYTLRQDSEKMLAADRDRKGCHGIGDIVRYSISDLRFHTCPGNAYDRSCLFILEAHNKYKTGILPFEGPLTRQPAKIIEAFHVIDSYNVEVQKAEAERQKRVQQLTAHKKPQGRVLSGRHRS